MKKAVKAAMVATAPMLPPYLFIGMAFGLLMVRSGFSPIWPMLMSLAIYAGSMQFIAIDFLLAGMGVVQLFVVTLAANLRHIFYGLSLLETFRGEGRRKLYLIFALSDETYSLQCSSTPPEGVAAGDYRFYIALLNQLYWLAGTLLGAVAGGLLTFDTTGIDFAMTAMFISICVEQWRSFPSHAPAVVGAGCALGMLILLGGDGFMLPALALMTGMLLMLRRRLEERERSAAEGRGASC